MKYIIVEIATDTQAPLIDIFNEAHWEPLSLHQAAREVTRLNREAGKKLYRLGSL